MTAEDNSTAQTGCESVLSREDVREVEQQTIQADTDVFGALANDTRYKILRLILLADDSVCGCELEPHLDVGQSSISQSLSRLRAAGLLTRTKDGRWRYYDTTPLAEAVVEALDDAKRVPKATV